MKLRGLVHKTPLEYEFHKLINLSKADHSQYAGGNNGTHLDVTCSETTDRSDHVNNIYKIRTLDVSSSQTLRPTQSLVITPGKVVKSNMPNFPIFTLNVDGHSQSSLGNQSLSLAEVSMNTGWVRNNARNYESYV